MTVVGRGKWCVADGTWLWFAGGDLLESVEAQAASKKPPEGHELTLGRCLVTVCVGEGGGGQDVAG